MILIPLLVAAPFRWHTKVANYAFESGRAEERRAAQRER